MIRTLSFSKDEIIQILVGQEGGISSVTSTAGGSGGTFVVRGSNAPRSVESPRSIHAGCDPSSNTIGTDLF